MSILLKGMDMPNGNSTINVLIYSNGDVFTGSVKDVDFSAIQAADFKVSRGLNEDGILYVPYADVKKYLKQSPSAERIGHWKYAYALEEYRYRCSECFSNHRAKYNYCPSCGAKMESEQ